MKWHLPHVLALLFVACILAGSGTAAPDAPPARERLLFDFGWKFHLGNEWGAAENLSKAGTGFGPAGVTFSDASWRRVDLPHDWAIELPFDPKADMSHGFKALGTGYPDNSVGWYRRTFDLGEKDKGRRIWIDFDGVFRDATVFVNGWFVGHHESGYSSFHYDITDLVNCGGTNVVAVKVDASLAEGWFYEGAGIYRHVWLEKTGPLAIAPDGVFVYSRFKGNVPTGPAEIHVETQLLNKGASANAATVTWEIVSPGGKSVASARRDVQVAAASRQSVENTLKLRAPELWSPETPQLYKLITTVMRDNAPIDRIETSFGVRTVAFDVEKGFLLNGKPYVLKGTCNHQDHAGVGVALTDALQDYRVQRLKDMGCNAYRTSHNPPTPELLDACDRLGLLVMDENRLLGSDAANLQRWEEQIRRDRNHPSVAIWSVANEEFTVQATDAGARVAKTMQDLVQRLDPTRPVTYAAPVGNEFAGINSIIEVRGWNYHVGPDMDAYHTAHPTQPNVGTEQASTVGTRGIYANDPERGYVSAYDDNAPAWATTAEKWMTYFDPRAWLSGGFVWTGFDYRGEPTPYGWPCISSHFGVMDTCGFPKDNFWYYKAWWGNEPVLHLMPHWNWAGREGQAIEVRALTNCDEVELFLNGQSQGRKKIERMVQAKWSVPYTPGTLSAKGYKSGKLALETKVETTGPATAIQLHADRTSIKADGEDLSIVNVALTDAQGRVVPTAGNHVRFQLTGPGRIIGVGNGDPSCHEPDVYISEPTTRTTAIDDWRWHEVPTIYIPNLPEVAPNVDDSQWQHLDVNADAGPLTHRVDAVFRGHLNISAQDLASPGVELWLGKIDGDASVFVNGEKIGPGGDPRAPALFDVKSHLHPGENIVAVSVANYSSAGGLSHGAKLRYVQNPADVSWSRSAFNGYAQVIIRARRTAGPITLQATADGLQSAMIAIESHIVPPQPVVAVRE